MPGAHTTRRRARRRARTVRRRPRGEHSCRHAHHQHARDWVGERGDLNRDRHAHQSQVPSRQYDSGRARQRRRGLRVHPDGRSVQSVYVPGARLEIEARLRRGRNRQRRRAPSDRRDKIAGGIRGRGKFNACTSDARAIIPANRWASTGVAVSSDAVARFASRSLGGEAVQDGGRVRGHHQRRALHRRRR